VKERVRLADLDTNARRLPCPRRLPPHQQRKIPYSGELHADIRTQLSGVTDHGIAASRYGDLAGAEYARAAPISGKKYTASG
jgi:hypothetical protein